jgi:hypothetical protein
MSERAPTTGPDARPKRKKKRARAAATSGEEPAKQISVDEAELATEASEDVPAFAIGWPRDAELTALVTAFEAGDYARVRREAPALAQRTEDRDVRRAARELAKRLDPDPVAVYMLAAAAMLLVFLAGWYWSHPHHP